MTKLSNGIHYNNINLPAEFSEYLIQNGYFISCNKDALLFYKKEGWKIYVKGDCIDVFKFTPENEYCQWVFKQSFTGIIQLNIFGWIMLMHIMSVITIKEFLKNAASVDEQLATEAKSIINSVLQYQLPTQKEFV